MSRLVDRILRYGFHLDNEEELQFDGIWGILKTCEVLICDNAAEMLVGTHESWSLRDYPALMPPFRALFAETHVPGYSQDVGALLVTGRYPEDCGEYITNIFADVCPEWIVHGDVFVSMDRQRVGPADYVGEIMYGLDTTGTACGESAKHYSTTIGGRDVVEQEQQDWASIHPLLLAIALSTCKNVGMPQCSPLPPKLARAHERKYGYPSFRYRVLEIEPMRQTLRTEGHSETQGIKRALHICRGHFKTYTPERKLFGQHVGTYWWPALARGTSSRGVVAKDYKIGKGFEHGECG